MRRLRRVVIVFSSVFIFLGVFLLPGTVYSESGAVKRICVIQGSGSNSPSWGNTITTQGVVHLDLDEDSPRGFYIQDEACDENPETSDGIFVFLDERIDLVNAGDLVRVSGVVEEYFGMTEIVAGREDVTVLSSGNPLPAVTNLDPPADLNAARLYLETLESMYVGMDEAVTVGPTDTSGWSWVIDPGWGIDHVFWDDPEGTGKIICIGDGGTYELDPQVKTGDRILNLRGAVDYELGSYCVRLSAEARVIQETQSSSLEHSELAEVGAGEQQITSEMGEESDPSFRLATFNLYNLFDADDDPQTDDTVLSAAEYQRRLQKRAKAINYPLEEPDFIGVQEVENGSVISALVSRPELSAEYGYIWQDSPDKRGLDVALLYRKDRTDVTGYQVHQGCIKLVDGLGPDGNGDVKEPQNAKTCDSDGNGSLDGNRLFSRPPLVVEARICLPDCAVAKQEFAIWLVVNHFKSKIEDTLTQAYTLPRRVKQAEFVAQLVAGLRAGDAGVMIVVLGDLNDQPGSQPLSILEQSGLQDTLSDIPRSDRYTYVFQGISQEMDYVLEDIRVPFTFTSVSAYHFNADFPAVFTGVNASIYRSSDHDPVVVEVIFPNQLVFIPQSLNK